MTPHARPSSKLTGARVPASRLAAVQRSRTTMGTDFCVAPGNSNTVTAADGVFTYAFPWGDGVAWSDGAVFRIVSDDGEEVHDFEKGDGQLVGDCLAFTFVQAQPGISYEGRVIDGEYLVDHFGTADLCALQHPNDPCSHLPFPDAEGDVPSDDEESADDSSPAAVGDASGTSSYGDDLPAGPDPDADPDAVANASSAARSVITFL
jgi:hypothetical protein